MALTEQEADAIARRIVTRLCGNRWVTPPARMVDTYPVPQSRLIFVSGRPIIEVHSVTIDGEVVDPADFAVSNRSAIRIAQTVRVPVIRGKRADVEVDYTYGVYDLPEVMERAVAALAAEILAADTGSTCRLPERVTNISRQGVSWTLIDPQDFLDSGRTGVYEVDLAIKVMNPSKAKARARIFTTTTSAPPIRRAT